MDRNHIYDYDERVGIFDADKPAYPDEKLKWLNGKLMKVRPAREYRLGPGGAHV